MYSLKRANRDRLLLISSSSSSIPTSAGRASLSPVKEHVWRDSHTDLRRSMAVSSRSVSFLLTSDVVSGRVTHWKYIGFSLCAVYMPFCARQSLASYRPDVRNEHTHVRL